MSSRRGAGGLRVWTLQHVDFDNVRTLVNSYLQRDPVTSLTAMERIRPILQELLTETKNWLSLTYLPRNQNPAPLALQGEGELLLAPLISHVHELINVISADVDLLRKSLEGYEWWIMRTLVSKYISRMIEMVNALVTDETKEQNIEDVGYLIWETRSTTLDKLLTGLLCSFCRHDNPQPLVSLEKLGRIQQSLQHVLYLLTIPAPSFPIAQLSSSVEHGSVVQQVKDALRLIDLVDDGLIAISEQNLHKLKMDDLAKVCDLVSKVNTTLEERAFAEGAVLEEEEAEQD